MTEHQFADALVGELHDKTNRIREGAESRALEVPSERLIVRETPAPFYVLGIDPGQTGAIATLDGHGNLTDLIDMPVVDKKVSSVMLASYLSSIPHPIRMVVIENVHSMPRQGVASSFKFGRAKGVVEGATAAAFPDAAIALPSPASWKRDMKVTADKDKIREMVVLRWPGNAHSFKRKKDADRAEAVLLAEWGRLRLIAEGRVSRPAASLQADL